MSYKIIKYDPAYNEQICGLEKANWGSDMSVSRSYLRWKYLENPYSDEPKPKLFLVLHAGELVAARGAYESIWQTGDNSEKFTAICMSDLVIRQDYQSKGIFPQLMVHMVKDLRDLGYQYLFNFSASSVNYISSLTMGWKSVSSISVTQKALLARPLADKLKVRSLVPKLWNRTGAGRFFNLFPENKRIEYELLEDVKKLPANIIFDTNPSPSDMSSLVRKTAKKDKIFLARDDKFFSWRYRNPLSKYFFLYWYDGELKGYLTFQTPRFRYDSMINFNILELEAEDSKIKIGLLDSLITLLGFRSITVWTQMLEDETKDYLASKQFCVINTQTGVSSTQGILVRTTDENNNHVEFKGLNLADPGNWDLKMIYSDNY